MMLVIKKCRILFLNGFIWGIGLLSSILVGLLAFKYFIGLDRLTSLSSYFFANKTLSSETSKLAIEKLVKSGKIIPFDSIFIQTLSYYDTLITILISLLSIFAAVSFFYIKHNSEEKSIEHVEKYTDKYFKEKKFDLQIKTAIQNGIEEWFESTSIQDVDSRLSKIEESISETTDKLGE